MKTHVFRIFSIFLILINSTGALFGGLIFMIAPSGKLLEMQLETLRFTSFNNYFIPGLILFLVNGLFGLVVLIMIYIKHKKYPEFIVIQAFLLGGWIIIQMMLLRVTYFLHFFYLTIAAALLVLGILLRFDKKRFLNL